LGVPRPVILAAFEDTGIDPERRAETLSLEEFAALADRIRERIS
jgi:16S rRNA A1518/A1519 N6-dimethyltransferase RsmA/KsgA/DIM1 with predicted DNA glycosylase/AP lyase activity